MKLALGHRLPIVESSHCEKDLILYALGVGAGADPTHAAELQVLYEGNADGFVALPTFGVVPALNAVFQKVAEGALAPGLNFGLDRVLHGEQYTELLRPLPVKARLRHEAHVKDIWDKGKHAVIVTHIDSFDAQTHELLVTNDLSMVVRGAGGWGGERGPSSDIAVPDRPPDAVVVEKTSAAQALLYRLSGDTNPLHVDPQFAAAMFNFPRPILHGLCTFGFAGRAAFKAFCGSDPRRFRSIRVRFADSVFPGETLATEMWKDGAARVLLRTSVVERKTFCLTNAVVEMNP